MNEVTKTELRAKIKQARHNYCRQRTREVDGHEVYVSSSFWEQVGCDYRRQLRALLSAEEPTT